MRCVLELKPSANLESKLFKLKTGKLFVVMKGSCRQIMGNIYTIIVVLANNVFSASAD